MKNIQMNAEVDMIKKAASIEMNPVICREIWDDVPNPCGLVSEKAAGIIYMAEKYGNVKFDSDRYIAYYIGGIARRVEFFSKRSGKPAATVWA